MGATVLHEEAIFPVRQEGIPINIRNTNRPQDPGTLIVESTCRKPQLYDHRYCRKERICCHQHRKRYDELRNRILAAKSWSVFEDNGISIEHMPSGIDTMTVFVHQSEFEENEQTGTGRYPPCCAIRITCESGV